MNTFIQNQNWRYAVKKYDATKKVSPEDLEILKQAIRFSPSSYGLQPYRVLVIENQELRKKLKAAAYGQTPITEASHLVVFANIIGFGDNDIDAYIKNISQTREVALEAVEGFSSYMKSQFSPMAEDFKNQWTSKQTYIALANLLGAAADLKIDATPMEGFSPEQFNEILELDKLGLNASVIAVVGYRHEEDAAQHQKKVRKPNEELFINL